MNIGDKVLSVCNGRFDYDTADRSTLRAVIKDLDCVMGTEIHPAVVSATYKQMFRPMLQQAKKALAKSQMLVCQSYLSALMTCAAAVSGVGGSAGQAPYVYMDMAGLYAVMDVDGRSIVAPGEYDYIEEFMENRAGVEKAGQRGFINEKGTIVVQLKYEPHDAVGDFGFNEGRALVKKEGLAGFIDLNGNEVVSLKYRTAEAFYEGRAVVMKDVSQWTIIDLEGKEIGKTYTNVYSFSEGLAQVSESRGGDVLYGFIDKDGNEVIRPQYRRVYGFHQGECAVEQYGHNFVIDKAGKTIRELRLRPT